MQADRPASRVRKKETASERSGGRKGEREARKKKKKEKKENETVHPAPDSFEQITIYDADTRESGTPLKIVLLHALGVSPFRGAQRKREREREARLREISPADSTQSPRSRAEYLVNSKVSSRLKIAKSSAGSGD